jgi:hypothetical protein
MLIKIVAEIKVEDFCCNFKDKSELDWFKEMMEDRANTMLILHSNDVGDTIGYTTDFKWKIVNSSDKRKSILKNRLFNRLVKMPIINEKVITTTINPEYD